MKLQRSAKKGYVCRYSEIGSVAVARKYYNQVTHNAYLGLFIMGIR